MIHFNPTSTSHTRNAGQAFPTCARPTRAPVIPAKAGTHSCKPVCPGLPRMPVTPAYARHPRKAGQALPARGSVIPAEAGIHFCKTV